MLLNVSVVSLVFFVLLALLLLRSELKIGTAGLKFRASQPLGAAQRQGEFFNAPPFEPLNERESRFKVVDFD